MIYLDYAATAPLKYPSSKYDAWLNANTPYAISSRKSMTRAEELVKKALGVKSGKVLFGGCASEIVDKIFNADAETWRIVSPYEHDCIYQWNDEIAKEVDDIPRYNTWRTIYCHQLVNNVTGAIFNLKPYGDWAKEDDHHIFLCDLTASIGKVKIPDFEELGVDIALWSGHKLGTEKNLGCAWFSDKALKWLGEDFKLQEGTPNVEGAVAVAEASWDAINANITCYTILEAELAHLLKSEALGEIIRFGVSSDAILAVYLPSVNADALQMYLASKEIYVGLGASACAEKHDYRQLEAFGLTKEKAEHIIRVSFGDGVNAEDIEKLVINIKEFIEKFI